MHVVVANDKYYYVLTYWVHAILEERNNPSISPKFSSMFAFKEGRLCLASNVESLVYLFICGRTIVIPIWVLIEYTNKDKNIV